MKNMAHDILLFHISPTEAAAFYPLDSIIINTAVVADCLLKENVCIHVLLKQWKQSTQKLNICLYEGGWR